MTFLRQALVMLAVAVVMLLALAPDSIASASAYPPDEPPTVTVPNPVGPPGYPVTVVVDGCVPGETVVITLGDETVEATCDDETIQVVVVVPAPSVPGVYEVVVTFPDRPEVPPITATIQVVSGVPATTMPPASGPLPQTGSGSVSDSIRLALGLLVAGGGMVAVARLRSNGHRPSASDG